MTSRSISAAVGLRAPWTFLGVLLALAAILALGGCDLPRDSGGGSNYGSGGGGGHSHH